MVAATAPKLIKNVRSKVMFRVSCQLLKAQSVEVET